MVESVTVLGVREETAAGRAVEIRRSGISRCWLWRGRGLPVAAGVFGPVTNEQHRVKLKVGRTILQVSVPVGTVVESVTVLGVREETAAGRAVEIRRTGISRCWVWRGRGLPVAAGVFGPVTNEQHRVKLKVGRTILQVSVPVGTVVESVTVLGVREETAAGRAVEIRRSGISRCWLWRGRGLPVAAGVFGPVTNEQYRVKLKVGRAIF